MNNLYAILPCYNESENIGALIDDWLNQAAALEANGYRLIVVGVDDKSTDNTRAIIQAYSEKTANVVLLSHTVNQNLGGALKTGFQYFIKTGTAGDVCVVMDGDNTHDPQFACSMFEKIKSGANCVIASRYCGDSQVVGVPGFRKFLSDGAKFYYKLILGVHNVNDYTCGYRMYTYEILAKANDFYADKFIERKTFSCMMEVLYKLARIGCSFAEVPFVLRYDKKEGASKMKILKTVYDSVMTALKLKFKL